MKKINVDAQKKKKTNAVKAEIIPKNIFDTEEVGDIPLKIQSQVIKKYKHVGGSIRGSSGPLRRIVDFFDKKEILSVAEVGVAYYRTYPTEYLSHQVIYSRLSYLAKEGILERIKNPLEYGYSKPCFRKVKEYYKLNS